MWSIKMSPNSLIYWFWETATNSIQFSLYLIDLSITMAIFWNRMFHFDGFFLVWYSSKMEACNEHENSVLIYFQIQTHFAWYGITYFLYINNQSFKLVLNHLSHIRQTFCSYCNFTIWTLLFQIELKLNTMIQDWAIHF